MLNFCLFVVCRYSVMAGVPEKMLEHLLETRIDSKYDPTDTFLEDFLLTHIVFMPSEKLCPALLQQYPSTNDGSMISPSTVLHFH